MVHSHTLIALAGVLPWFGCFAMESDNLDLIKTAAIFLGYDNLRSKQNETIIPFSTSIPKYFKQTTLESATSIHPFSKGTV